MTTDDEESEEESVFSDCESCNIAVLGGGVILMCQNESPHKDRCEELNEKFSTGEISLRDLATEVREMLPENIQEQLDNMMNDLEEMREKKVPNAPNLDAKLPADGVTPDDLEGA